MPITALMTTHIRVITRWGLLMLGLTVAQSFAAPEDLEVGRGRLVVTGSARVTHDSNIFLSNTEISDTVGTVNGELRYVRDRGVVTMEAAAGLEAQTFASHSSQNSADPSLGMKLGYDPDEKTIFHSNLQFRRSSIANETVNDRTKSDDLSLDATLEHLFSEKLGWRASTAYSNSDYLTAGYSDVFSYSLGVQAVHVYSPKLKLLAGVARIESWTSHRPGGRRSPSNQDLRYTFGAEGELAPKLTGDVQAGVVRRSFDSPGFPNAGALYMAARVSWAASEKTSWNVRAMQDLSLSTGDQSVRASSLTLNLTQVLSRKMSFDGSAGVDHSAYTGFNGAGNRSDDGVVLRGRMNYLLKSNMSLDVSAGYRKNNSTVAVSTYSRFNFGVGLSTRF